MVYKRLLTSLATHPSPSSGSHGASRLVPPYSYDANALARAESFRPPYEHRLPPLPLPSQSEGDGQLRSSSAYSIVDALSGSGSARARTHQAWVGWARPLLSSDKGREKLLSKWQESVEALERLRSRSSMSSADKDEVKQIPFHSLSARLAESAQEIRDRGLVVVRDVVGDDEAIEWARGALRAINERDGRPVFWHKALLEARSNPSVLSANAQVMAALTGVERVYVHADSIYEGLSSGYSVEGATGIFDLDDAWRSTGVSVPGSTPLLSHLTLTPSLPKIPTVLSPSKHAATYSMLRPLFRPVRSRISFYASSDYLHPSNWALLDPSDLPESTRSSTSTSTSIDAVRSSSADLPHLAGTEIVLPSLAPGDMVLRHSSLPLTSAPGSGQVFLPLSPVPREGNEVWAKEQRDKFERGLPPPGTMEGTVLLEPKGSREHLGGRAGREAMGY